MVVSVVFGSPDFLAMCGQMDLPWEGGDEDVGEDVGDGDCDCDGEDGCRRRAGCGVSAARCALAVECSQESE